MADLAIIDRIDWDVTKMPTKAEITEVSRFQETPRDRNYRSLTSEEWQRIVLPEADFVISYPDGSDPNFDYLPTSYETDGLPVTLLDLLTTIYNFYQEKIPGTEILRWSFLGDEKYIAEIRIIRPNTYRLNLIGADYYD